MKLTTALVSSNACYHSLAAKQQCKNKKLEFDVWQQVLRTAFEMPVQAVGTIGLVSFACSAPDKHIFHWTAGHAGTSHSCHIADVLGYCRKQHHQEAAADLELVTQQLHTAQQQLHKAQEDLRAHDQQADISAQQAAAITSNLQQQLEAAGQKLQHKQRFWAQEVQRVEQHWQQQLQVVTREQDAKVRILSLCCGWLALLLLQHGLRLEKQPRTRGCSLLLHTSGMRCARHLDLLQPSQF
jgi:hypothetical protein